MIISNTLWAYGSGSNSPKSCAKPEFSNFAPAENATVVTGSTFSFYSSANTFSNTIKVSVKGMATTINVTQKNEGGFLVTGKIPATLSNVYARITITADGQNNCKGEGGWLIKIAD
jgi:hypothetical protein